MPAEWNSSTTEVSLGSAAVLDDLCLLAWSLSLWMKPDGIGELGTGRILSKRPLSQNGGFLFFTDATASLGFQIIDSGGGVESHQRGSNNAITFNIWQHVLLTYDDDGDVKGHIYVDGSEIAYDTNTAGTTGNAATDADDDMILGNNQGATRTFDGHMADFGIWTRVLSAEDIIVLAAGASPMLLQDSLVLYCPLLVDTADVLGNIVTDTVAPTFTTEEDPGKLFRPTGAQAIPITAAAPYSPIVTVGNADSELAPHMDLASGAPSHAAEEGTMYWDSTANVMYVNNNGSTGWTALN